MLGIRKEQARRFLLAKNGLLGSNGLRGREGVLAYVRQAGCIQFDAVDLCGQSHELALLARVKGFSKELLSSLLYEERELIEFFDKNMCIMSVQDWPYLTFLRSAFRFGMRSRGALENWLPQVFAQMQQHGSLSVSQAEQLGAGSLGRAALETLYARGDAVIHHREGEQKYYAPAVSCLPRELVEAQDPFQSPRERQMWQVMRRIGAVGMLWNDSSDAWLGVEGMSAQARNEIFYTLTQLGVILPVAVEGISQPLFLLGEDLPLLKQCQFPVASDRSMRLLPPLDCLLWDRKLIREVFGFSYKWEIYTPENQRRYGAYVLPVVYGEGFCGRVEPVCDRENNALIVKRFWPEGDVRVNDRFLWALEDVLGALQRFHGLKKLVWQEHWLAEKETF